MTDRVFGRHEAAAMFEAIGNALAVIGTAGSASGEFLQELKRERELLLEHRLALSRLVDAVRAETSDISVRLHTAMQQAEKALD